jgi:Holliday junction resolvase RusA-like endonuclease
MCEISKKIIKMQGTPGTGYSGKIKIEMAALSVNQAWQGRRFKTPEYKRYERDLKKNKKDFDNLIKCIIFAE